MFSQVDLLLVPSLRDEMLTISNFTGHPSLTLRAGFVNVVRGAQRLGARSEESAAEVLAAAPRAARRDAARPAVRRRHDRARRARAGAGVRRGRRAAAGVLNMRRATSLANASAVRRPVSAKAMAARRSLGEGGSFSEGGRPALRPNQFRFFVGPACPRPARSASSNRPSSFDSSQNIAPARCCAAMYSPLSVMDSGSS